MNAVILVGRRAGDPRRDCLWEYCQRRWEAQVGLPIFEGHHDAEENEAFCIAVASNRAAEAAGDWDVAFYIGADWIVAGADQVHAATKLAVESGQLVFAHGDTCVLSEDVTNEILTDVASPIPAHAGVDGSWHTNTFSGALAVPRVLWDAVGGFDERFVGWGWEDLAFWSACCALGGGYQRVPGMLAHLWHPQVWDLRENNPNHNANMVLGQRYLDAKWDRPRMLEILAERAQG